MLIAVKPLENSMLSAASRLFSPGLIRELAQKGFSGQFSRLARESSLLDQHQWEAPLWSFFEKVFSLLQRRELRHEYIYKSVVARKILLGKHSLQTAAMLTEFRVGSCKADVAILNGTSTVYEIKSERDSLVRIHDQVSWYGRFFAHVNVITGENHIKNVLATVHEDVGVLLLTDRFQIATIRKSQYAPERISQEVIFDSIRRDEAKKILKKYGVEIPAVPNTLMYSSLRKLFFELTQHQAHEGMVEVLGTTRSQSEISDIIKAIPHSLQAVVLSLPLTKKEYSRLLNVMNTPIIEALKWT
jgi:hypothetical protein